MNGFIVFVMKLKTLSKYRSKHIQQKCGLKLLYIYNFIEFFFFSDKSATMSISSYSFASSFSYSMM